MANRRHGQWGTPTWNSWSSMRTRCNNPNTPDYPRYGGRGIMVCARWLDSFENFLADMGARPEGTTLDRKDVNGNYEPTNCRWATDPQQRSNTRRSRFLTAFGETLTVAQWAKRTGISAVTLRSRIDKHGYSPERALSAGRYEGRKVGNERKGRTFRAASGQFSHPAALSARGAS